MSVRGAFRHDVLRRGVLRLGRAIQRRERRLVPLLVLIAGLSMAASATLFRPTALSIIHYRPTASPTTYYPLTAPLAALVGGLALVFALLLAPARVRFPMPERPHVARWGRGWSLLRSGIVLLLGIGLLWLVAEANGQLLGVRVLKGMHYHIQFALLCAGIVLVARGAAGGAAQGAAEGVAGGAASSAPTTSQGVSGFTGDRGRELARGATGGAAGGAASSAPTTRQGVSGFAGNRGLFKWLLTLPRRELALVALLTLAALGVRLWRLDSVVRMMIDESHFMMGAMYFWRFDDVRLLEPMPTNAAFPFLYSYGIDWGVTLAGRTFAGLRLFSVLLGTLTIPAVYLLARHLYDRLTAVIAALVLISYPPHIHFSRLALNNIADPLFGTLALGLIARALHTSRRRDYVLAGAALGLTQYFYEGGRLLFPLLVIAWLGAGAVLWRPRPSPRGVILLLLAFGLAAAPIYYTLAGLHFPLMSRLDQTQMDDIYWQRQREDHNTLTLVRHFHHALMTYVHMPENTLVYYYLYYGGRHPLVLEPLVPLFLLGVVIAAWRWRTPGTLPAGWVLANVLGNASLVESAVSARYVTTFPAVALLIAVGLRYTVGLVWPDTGRRQRFRTALLIAAAVGIAVGQTVYYYRDHLPLFEREIREPVRADAEDALWRARDFPPGTHVHLVGDGLLPEVDAQRFADFVADGLFVRVWPGDSLTVEVLNELPRDVDQAFFVQTSDINTQNLLVALFGPIPFQTTDRDIPAHKILLLYYLPAAPDPRPG